MLTPDVTRRIRAIFLHPEPRLTVTVAARLLGWRRQEMRAATTAGEIAVTDTCSGPRIELEEIFAKALEIWPLVVIEEALGAEGRTILPRAARSRQLRVRLSQYQIATLDYLAEHGYLSIDGCLARAVDDLASAHSDELAAAVPGFAEAFAWPNPNAAQAAEPWHQRRGLPARVASNARIPDVHDASAGIRQEPRRTPCDR